MAQSAAPLPILWSRLSFRIHHPLAIVIAQLAALLPFMCRRLRTSQPTRQPRQVLVPLPPFMCRRPSHRPQPLPLVPVRHIAASPPALSTYFSGQRTSHTRIRPPMSTQHSTTPCKSLHLHLHRHHLPSFSFANVNTTCSTSPSVYMVVSTIFGYNSAGRAGPSGTSVVFALDLDQVSTIVPGGSATQQLTLNDLGTDCPQSEDASWIATAAPDGQCDPILVAPDPVKSWALPCNACGRFGLFDPPYAVPPLTGGLVPATTTAISTPVAPTPTPVSTTSSVITSSSYRDPNATIPMVTASSATKVTGGLACLILSLFVSVCLL